MDIKLVVKEFIDYALVWWDNFEKDKRRNEERL
jgi:hypothetical protein